VLFRSEKLNQNTKQEVKSRSFVDAFVDDVSMQSADRSRGPQKLRKSSENQATSLFEKANKEQVEFMKRLLSCQSKKFSIGGEANELPVMLGLFVKQFGYISLPLYDQQAENLIQHYTKNTDTSTSESESMLKLGEDSIKIQNPEWSSKLQELVDRVTGQLAVKGKAEAKFLSVILFKEKAILKQRKIKERDKNAFARLIIQLPSFYDGGEFEVFNGDMTRSVHDLTKQPIGPVFHPWTFWCSQRCHSEHTLAVSRSRAICCESGFSMPYGVLMEAHWLISCTK